LLCKKLALNPVQYNVKPGWYWFWERVSGCHIIILIQFKNNNMESGAQQFLGNAGE
jgi:hypothetical protein